MGSYFRLAREFGQAAIERGQPCAVTNGEGQQVSIGNLLMSGCGIGKSLERVRRGNCIGPEFVQGLVHIFDQQFQSLSHR